MMDMVEMEEKHQELYCDELQKMIAKECENECENEDERTGKDETNEDGEP